MLLIASNRGFRDFGFIGGVGMILCWASTFAFLPAVLTVLERLRPARYPPARAGRGRALALLERFFARPRAIVAIFALLTSASAGLFLWRLPDAMERNLDNLSNEVSGNAVLKRDNDRANAALGQSISGVVALLPSPQAAQEYCGQVRRRMEATPRLRDLIDGCETITSVVPAHQPEKLAVIADIRERLTDRVLSRLPTAQADRARALRAQLAAQHPVTAADAPPVLVDRFRERDGSIGRLSFVRAKPQAKLELGPNLRDFVAGVRNVPVEGQRYDAAGETVVIADLLADIEREGPRTTLYAFAGICLLVVVFFRSATNSALILTTLSVGVLIMAGVASAIDLKVNFFNFVVYPITFGIAVDYGANVLDRQRVRGTVLPSLVEVGPAVALCSWTTIVGYGSLIFSINRALRSFGWYAMLGELTTILTALILLPAVALAWPALRAQEVKYAP
jgi:predicted RND superfamily exporter protein